MQEAVFDSVLSHARQEVGLVMEICHHAALIETCTVK